MKKNKIYFPISDNFNNFVGLTNSKEGLVCPIINNNENRFHVTAYIKTLSEKEFYLNIHVTDEITKKQHPIYALKFHQEDIDELGKKCQEFALNLIPILQKCVVKDDEIDKSQLYCVSCVYNDIKLPTKLSSAKESWTALSKLTEKDIAKYPPCNNPKHNMLFDYKSKTMLMFASQQYIDIEKLQKQLNKMGLLIEKYFPKVTKTMEEVFEKIQKVCTE